MRPPLLQALAQRPLLGDGAMGTQLMGAGLEQGRSGEAWNLTHPERVLAIQRRYVEAGSECLQALDIAKTQRARSLELRAATSLARLWRDQGKRTEARDLLAPVYNWFTEGLDTPVLIEARALLEQLTP